MSVSSGPTESPPPNSLSYLAALEYISRGWFVLPLKPMRKAPLTRNGVNDSSNRPEIIRRWFTKNPDANVGIDLGRSGLLGIGPDSVEWSNRFA